jgi:hypothetical protein
VPTPGGEVQWRVAAYARLRPDRSFGPDQEPSDLEVPLLGCQVQRGQTIPLDRVGIGTFAEQGPDGGHITCLDRIQQRVAYLGRSGDE